jgi:hypothetical protein
MSNSRVQSQPVKDLGNDRVQSAQDQRASGCVETLLHPHEGGQERAVDHFQFGQIDRHAIVRTLPGKRLDDLDQLPRLRCAPRDGLEHHTIRRASAATPQIATALARDSSRLRLFAGKNGSSG